MNKQSSTMANKDLDKINYPDKIEKLIEFSITAGQRPERLDVFLTREIPNATRTKIQDAIDESCITVNGKIAKASQKIKGGDNIICKIMKPPPIELIPENIPLDIVFEDEYLLVVNKPAGMPTHPGFGNRVGTLVNALIYHLGVRDSIEISGFEDDDELEDEDSITEEIDIDEGKVFSGSKIRPGIVHRLDKDTSGLLVVGKTPSVLAELSKQFADRTVDRNYYALVWGIPKENSGRIEANLNRSKRDRKVFETVISGGKTAITDYSLVESICKVSLVKLKLHTGRTHQIRVHLKSIFNPVFGDITYGGDKIIHGGEDVKFKRFAEKLIKKLSRQALHAKTLGFTHPVTKERLFFESEIADDMKFVIDSFKTYFETNSD